MQIFLFLVGFSRIRTAFHNIKQQCCFRIRPHVSLTLEKSGFQTDGRSMASLGVHIFAFRVHSIPRFRFGGTSIRFYQCWRSVCFRRFACSRCRQWYCCFLTVMHLISQVFSLLCSVIVVYNRELCVYFPGRLYCSFHVACVYIALQQLVKSS